LKLVEHETAKNIKIFYKSQTFNGFIMISGPRPVNCGLKERRSLVATLVKIQG